MHYKPGFFLTGIIMGLINFSGVSAQVLPGQKDSINSAILNQKRFVQVVMPPAYKPGSPDKYDVVYILDGDGNTGLTNSVVQFISGENSMPPIIIVGVFNIDRTKDFTPTRMEGFNTSGGAAEFLAFLKSELIPYIDKKYPTDGENILFGHSFGGLFVTYALLTDLNPFKSYIAADPSYWWDKNFMIGMATKKLPALINSNRTLFITGREGQGMDEMGILPMDTILKKYAPAGFTWKITAYPDETHGTIRLKSIYDGLRFAYDGYRLRNPDFHPMAGILLKDKPIKIWYLDDTTKTHYTIDGSIPTLASPLIQHTVIMPGPGTFTAKTFTVHERFDRVTTGVFEAKGAPSPVAREKSFMPGGFHYAYYEGQWDSLPDFTILKPIKEGRVTKDFDLSKLPAQTNFGLVISGQLEVKEDGYHIFGLASDDGSRFYLSGQLLMDNNGLHDGSGFKSYVLPLKKGFYPVRLEFFQKEGGSSLRLVYFTPGMIDTNHPDPKGIPQELQYSKE